MSIKASRKTSMLKPSLTGSFFQWLKRMWPQVPLGLLLLFTGAANVLIGLQSLGFNSAFQIFAQMVPLSEVSQTVSLGILGSGVQIVLGCGMLLTGTGLFWRLRSAWAYTILLVLITIAVDLFSQRPFRDVLMPGLALAALVIWQSRFDHRSLVGTYLMAVIGLLSVLVYGILGSLLLGDNFQSGIHNLPTALYFTVVTLSTVGSNIYPETPAAQIFMVTLILGGIIIFTTTIVTTLGPLMSNQIHPILSTKKVKVEANPHVILMGAGSFAKSVALDLANHKISFIQLVAPEETPPLSEQPVIHGDPNDEIFKQAGILSTQVVIVAYENDAVNVSASLIAKKLNQKARVIVAASSSQTISQVRLAAQADLIFEPTAVGARLLTNLIREASIPRELQDLFEDLKKDKDA